MSRNIFSKIFSFYSLKLFFIVILMSFFTIKISNSYARILVANDADGLNTSSLNTNKDIDILYIPSSSEFDHLDMVEDGGETVHGGSSPVKLTSNDVSVVRQYLPKIKKERTDEISLYINGIKTNFNKRPDINIFSSNRPNPNSVESDKISKIVSSTSSKDFIYALDLISQTIYPGAYDQYFNSVAAQTDAQYWFIDDFQKDGAKKLESAVISYYMSDLLNYLNNKNNLTDEDKVVISRIKELNSASSLNGSDIHLDGNGTSVFNIIGSSNSQGNKTWPLNLKKIDWSLFENPSADPQPVPDPTPNPDPVKPSCNAEGFWSTMNSSDCSVTAYLVNSIISGIAQLFGIILGWIGALFNWIFDFSIMNFHSWIENSKAVDIYKTIILAFIASLMLPLVFYLVIRMLIDTDYSRNIEKLLPKILITALFVYFSFGIAGWLVDQSNIVTIYIYRAIHGGDTSQNLGDVIQCTLGIQAGCNKNAVDILNETGGVSMWEWSSVSYTFGQLLINLVGLYIVFQAMILIFARSIVFLLCLIFSPIMLLPDGLPGKIGEIITKYRGTVMTYFTNNLLLAPIFMFLMMLAIRIGKISGDLIPDTSSLDAQTAGHPGFLGGMIKTIIVIVVMQLAITVAKNLSGEVGSTISGAISNFAGGVASGATNAFNRIRGARQTNTGGGANNGTNPWQTNNTQARRPIPLQSTQSSVITPTGQSVQNQALGNNFAAASSKINKENQSIINSLPDTKRRSLGGYQAISNQRQKSAANRNSVQQKATQNNRSVATQTQVNNARIERKKNQANAKMGGGNNPSSPKAPQKLELARVNNSVSTQNPNTGVTNANQNSVTETTNPGVSPVSPNSSRNNQARELLKDKDVRQAVKEGGFGKAFVGGSPKKQQAMAGTLKAITQERMVKRDKSSSKASDQLADTNQKPKALIGNNKPDKV